MVISKTIPAMMLRRVSPIFWTAFILTILTIPHDLYATEPATPRELQQTPSANGRNQMGSKQDVTADGDARAGKELFGKHCATCHGPRGKGDGLKIVGAEVADLTSAATQRKLSVDMLKTIHEGRPEKVMPAWKWRLSQQQTKDVLAYIRTLKK
jgi:mono/diheme cytochrome c family protein